MSSSPPTDASPAEQYDPVFLHSRREAIVIFLLWLVGLLWAVPFCYYNGYLGNVDPASLTTTLGMPTWLFWGIFAPWIAADVFTMWFCFCYMKDDDLGTAHEGADIAEEVAEIEAAREKGQ